MAGACDGNAVIPGRAKREPGISRFRVWSYGPSRNDELPIQRLVPPENPVLVERDPSVARQIRLDVRPRRHPVAQFDETGNFALESLHAFRKGITQSLDDLEQRQVD